MKVLDKIIWSLVILTSIHWSTVGAQEKYEVEHRIHVSEVPSGATDLVEALPLKGKIKWYYEENSKGNSYEAKNKSRGHQYSIEFDTLGNFQDLEIGLPVSRMDSTVSNEIKRDLDQRFEFHKIRKIQVQYNDMSKLDEVIERGPLKFDRDHLYEIVIEGKRDNMYQLFELTYAQTGEWIKTYPIAPGNSDVLEY